MTYPNLLAPYQNSGDTPKTSDCVSVQKPFFLHKFFFHKNIKKLDIMYQSQKNPPSNSSIFIYIIF